MFHTSCESKKEEKEEEVKFLVTSPLQKDTLVTKEYVSQIRAISHIELRALERGYLQNIYVDEGQSVKKGQLMFKIMPMLYQAEQQKAQAEANFAEIEFKIPSRWPTAMWFPKMNLRWPKPNWTKPKRNSD